MGRMPRPTGRERRRTELRASLCFQIPVYHFSRKTIERTKFISEWKGELNRGHYPERANSNRDCHVSLVDDPNLPLPASRFYGAVLCQHVRIVPFRGIKSNPKNKKASSI